MLHKTPADLTPRANNAAGVSGVCARCGDEPAVARGLGRRCYNAEHYQNRKAARAQTKRRKARGLICTCLNYPFPHVRASLRFCAQHPRINVRHTDSEERAYMRVIETPRGLAA